MNIDETTTVGQVVIDHPAAARVFQRHGIDFCCGGEQPLASACEKKGVDLSHLLEEIEREALPDDTIDWSTMSLTVMCDTIEQRYHRHLDRLMPELAELAEKVARVHGDNHPELREIHGVYNLLKDELERHMMKEEQILFPIIRSTGMAPPPPVSVMRHEHEVAGEALSNLRHLSKDYQVPDDGCASYRAFYDGLVELERELFDHIHVENNILFVRASQ